MLQFLKNLFGGKSSASGHRLAIVTGGNRGLGLEIARQLARKDIQVILTSRDKEKGEAACKQLNDEGLAVLYHRLDVAESASIEEFTDDIEEVYGRCDILVNNAGIFPDVDNEDRRMPSLFETDVDVIRKAMETNVYGPVQLCQELVPVMKHHKYGRIVNLSSGLGQLSEMSGGVPGYRISKTALNAVTRIVADELKDTNIKINSMCPGWCKTEMGGPNATREPAEGAETAVWLATLPDDGPSGGFFRDKETIGW